eukprot:3618217-Lingulodinium_polyedra.AAC.1
MSACVGSLATASSVSQSIVPKLHVFVPGASFARAGSQGINLQRAYVFGCKHCRDRGERARPRYWA